MTFTWQTPIFSEKSKSEHIITPILKETFRQNIGRATYFSGYTFDVDTATNLNGICDYIFTRNAESIEIKAPIFCLAGFGVGFRAKSQRFTFNSKVFASL